MTDRTRADIAALTARVNAAVVGQEAVVHSLILALLCNGNVLLEGVPGLGKTELVKALSRVLELDFSRIQFTPDLMPADVIGTNIMSADAKGNYDFEFRQGPVFTQLLLADEINRAPAKVQSALLEAMQERQVTIGGETHPLPKPFLVLATQNPVEQEGTYPLPEAQVDRFLLKVVIGYPTKEEERQIVRANLQQDGLPKPQKVVSQKDVLEARELVRSIYMDEKIERYIVDLVFATRNPG